MNLLIEKLIGTFEVIAGSNSIFHLYDGRYSSNTNVMNLPIKWPFKEGFIRPSEAMNNLTVLSEVKNRIKLDNIINIVIKKNKWYFEVYSYGKLIYKDYILFTDTSWLMTYFLKKRFSIRNKKSFPNKTEH